MMSFLSFLSLKKLDLALQETEVPIVPTCFKPQEVKFTEC